MAAPHVLEPTTREKYTYYLSAHILPALGPMRMADTFPEHIREWIARMQREGQSAWTIQYCKSSILSSVFTTALNDQVTYIHPCRGVKIPTVPATVRTIITPEQFEVIYGRCGMPMPNSWSRPRSKAGCAGARGSVPVPEANEKCAPTKAAGGAR